METELIRFIPANEEDYPNYPAIVLSSEKGSYRVDAISMEGGKTEEMVEHPDLAASLAYITCVIVRFSEVEYVVDV